ncbi:MAG: hypothetical protein J6Y01_02695, partial [Spirochaetales bacterium]|nr:hypothetical protein [Spirochaetales bacterium]
MKLRFLSVILSIISLLMLGSCALNTTSTVHQNINKPAVQTSYIKITVGSNSRTALPDISADDFDCFVLTGVDTSGDAAISEKWDTSNDGTA